MILWYVLLYLLTILFNLSIYTFFYIKVIYLQILFFKILINLSATTDFTSLCIEYISVWLSCNHDFTDLLKNLLHLSTGILFGLRLVWAKIFWEALVILTSFLSVKGIIHAYSLKISITHDKRIALLNLLIKCISVRSTRQIWYIENECTFSFSNLLVIWLRNSSANSLFEIFSFLIHSFLEILLSDYTMFYQKQFF